MAFEIRDYPEFSWSLSKGQGFQKCGLEYYFNTYAGHNGWLYESSSEQKQAYRLKQLKGLYMYFGDVLHRCIEETIKRYDRYQIHPSYEEMERIIKQELNKAYQSSMHQKESFLLEPKKHPMYQEVYYQRTDIDKTIGNIKDRIAPCISNYLNSKTIHELYEGAVIKDMEVLNTISLPSETDDESFYKLYLKLDLLYQLGEKYVIVDWKTGNENEEENFKQATIYAMYVHHAYGIPYHQIEIVYEFLKDGYAKTFYITEEDVVSTAHELIQQIERAKTLIVGQDTSYNQPFDISAFENEARPSKFNCMGCNYREVCRKKYVI